MSIPNVPLHDYPTPCVHGLHDWVMVKDDDGHESPRCLRCGATPPADDLD